MDEKSLWTSELCGRIEGRSWMEGDDLRTKEAILDIPDVRTHKMGMDKKYAADS